MTHDTHQPPYGSEVWIIVARVNQPGGGFSHSDGGGSFWMLPTTGTYQIGPPHPAFSTETAARDYISSLEFGGGLQPLRLAIQT
jgi:hypothetical protein